MIGTQWAAPIGPDCANRGVEARRRASRRAGVDGDDGVRAPAPSCRTPRCDRGTSGRSARHVSVSRLERRVDIRDGRLVRSKELEGVGSRRRGRQEPQGENEHWAIDHSFPAYSSQILPSSVVSCLLGAGEQTLLDDGVNAPVPILARALRWAGGRVRHGLATSWTFNSRDNSRPAEAPQGPSEAADDQEGTPQMKTGRFGSMEHSWGLPLALLMHGEKTD